MDSIHIMCSLLLSPLVTANSSSLVQNVRSDRLNFPMKIPKSSIQCVPSIHKLDRVISSHIEPQF